MRALLLPTGLITRVIEEGQSIFYEASNCAILDLENKRQRFHTKYLRKATKQERFIYEMNGRPVKGE